MITSQGTVLLLTAWTGWESAGSQADEYLTDASVDAPLCVLRHVDCRFASRCRQHVDDGVQRQHELHCNTMQRTYPR